MIQWPLDKNKLTLQKHWRWGELYTQNIFFFLLSDAKIRWGILIMPSVDVTIVNFSHQTQVYMATYYIIDW